MNRLDVYDPLTVTFLLFLPVLNHPLPLELFVYLRLIIGILSLRTFAHRTVLSLFNPALNLTFSLLPITSSHPHASASDSTFDYWRYINVWLTLTLTARFSFDGQLSVSHGPFCPAHVLCYWCVVSCCWRIKIHIFTHLQVSFCVVWNLLDKAYLSVRLSTVTDWCLFWLLIYVCVRLLRASSRISVLFHVCLYAAVLTGCMTGLAWPCVRLSARLSVCPVRANWKTTSGRSDSVKREIADRCCPLASHE